MYGGGTAGGCYGARGYLDGALAFAAVAASVSAAVASTISSVKLSPIQAEQAMFGAVMRAHGNWRTVIMSGTDAMPKPDSAAGVESERAGCSTKTSRRRKRRGRRRRKGDDSASELSDVATSASEGTEGSRCSAEPRSSSSGEDGGGSVAARLADTQLSGTKGADSHRPAVVGSRTPAPPAPPAPSPPPLSSSWQYRTG